MLIEITGMENSRSLKQKQNLSCRSRGFTMIEMLVTTIIVSIGLLGVAGLQVKSLQYNQSAYFRSQATFIAYDMIDRMRMNADGVSAGQYDAVTTTTLPTEPTCVVDTTGCSSTDIASLDLNEIADSVGRLPSGTATVSSAANIFTVAVNWVEPHDTDDPTKTVSFEFRP